MSDGFSQTNEVVRSIITQAGVGGVIGGLGGLTVGVIVAIALLYGVVKLFVELLKSYVSIILLITFSPIILMTGAIPGQNSFGSWIKNLTGNLVAFPVVLLVLIVARAINNVGITTGGFAPPFLLGTTVGGGSALAGLVGIGMLLTTPEIVKKAKDAMGAKEGIMGELAGAAWDRFKQGAAAPGKTLQRTFSAGTGAYFGAKGARQLTQDQSASKQNWATVAGGLAGLIGGGTSNMPYNMASRIIKGDSELIARSVTRAGLQRAQVALGLKQAEAAAEKDKDAQKGSTTPGVTASPPPVGQPTQPLQGSSVATRPTGQGVSQPSSHPPKPRKRVPAAGPARPPPIK